MTKAKQKKAQNSSATGSGPDEDIHATHRRKVASGLTAPFSRHAFVAGEANLRQVAFLDDVDKPRWHDYRDEFTSRAAKAATGDRVASSELLTAQALSLDSIYTEYARIALVNIQNADASERYMRLALKAQSNARATLEALAKLHQPREQTVRHVHVNDGGQAVIADEFHHHSEGDGNEKSDEQPHATRAIGQRPALPGQDPQGNGVPISGREGEQPVPDARRQGKRRSQG